MVDKEVMFGCTHFKCEECNSILDIKYMNEVKVAFTAYSDRSIDELRFNPHYTMMCDKCLSGEKDDRDNNSKSEE